MINKSKNTRLNITISKETREKLSIIAKDHNKSMSALVNDIIKNYLDDYSKYL